MADVGSVNVVGEGGCAGGFGDNIGQGAHVGAGTADAGEGGDGEVVGRTARFREAFPVGADVDTPEVVTEGFARVRYLGNSFDFGARFGVDFGARFSSEFRGL